MMARTPEDARQFILDLLVEYGEWLDENELLIDDSVDETVIPKRFRGASHDEIAETFLKEYAERQARLRNLLKGSR